MQDSMVLGINHLFGIKLTVSGLLLLRRDKGCVQMDRCMRVQFIKMMVIRRGTSRDSIQCDASLAVSITLYQNPPKSPQRWVQ